MDVAAGWVGAPRVGQGAVNISPGPRAYRTSYVGLEGRNFEKLHGGLDTALAHLQRARSKLNPRHSDQQDGDGVDKNGASRERFEGKNKIIGFVTSALNWWLVILKEVSEKQTA